MYVFDKDSFREGIASARYDANLGYFGSVASGVTIEFLVQKIWEKYRDTNINLGFKSFKLEQAIPDIFELLIIDILSKQLTNQLSNISEDITNKSKIDQIGDSIINAILDKILNECKDAVGDNNLVSSIENFWKDIDISNDITDVLIYYGSGIIDDHTSEEESENDARLERIKLNLELFADKLKSMIENPLLLVVTALTKNSNALLNHSLLGTVNQIFKYINLGDFISYIYNPRKTISDLLKSKWDDGVNAFISESGLQAQIDEENARQMEEYQNNLDTFLNNLINEIMQYTVVKQLKLSGQTPENIIKTLESMSMQGIISFLIIFKNLSGQVAQGKAGSDINKYLSDYYIYFNEREKLEEEWLRVQLLFWDKFKYALAGGIPGQTSNPEEVVNKCLTIDKNQLKNKIKSKSVTISKDVLTEIINNKKSKEMQKTVVNAAGAGALTLAILKIFRFF